MFHQWALMTFIYRVSFVLLPACRDAELTIVPGGTMLWRETSKLSFPSPGAKANKRD